MWKVYGHVLPWGNVYGPLPMKRWIKITGERWRKQYKVSNGFAKSGSPKEYTAGRACLYATWLAKRDGKTIPDNSLPVPIWAESDHGAKRVCAVAWRERANSYTSTETKGPALLIVDIPHWDWKAADPTEELLSADTVAQLEKEACRKAPAKKPMKKSCKPNRTTTTERRANSGISSANQSKRIGSDTRRHAGL